MHEYEFRLVVQSPSSFLPLLQSIGLPIRKKIVYYVKPHFRFRNGGFETKRVETTRAVYHDRLWFRWIHSIETPYRSWSRSTCFSFLHHTGNFQDPFKVESRDAIEIDSRAQLYAFRNGDTHRLVFEWEWGTFERRKTRFDSVALLASLNRYRDVYGLMRAYSPPPWGPSSNERLSRRPVACVEGVPAGRQYLYAHKLDGTFGLVYSYADRIKEKWEGHECVVRRGVTLGDGLVFAAERMVGEVFLLDVYRVRGHETAGWCRRGILTEFLPELRLVEGYRVQTYVSERKALVPNPDFVTDGLIVHDVVRDTIYKHKPRHSIDLVYRGGYFHLPDGGRIRCSEKGLEEGCVYEISTSDGSVVRKRNDRFGGNTIAQVESILKMGWGGPPIER